MARHVIYRFGDYTLDTARTELRRGGDTVHLRPKVYALLCYLLEHRERTIGKNELLAQVWEGQALGDAVLASSITQARKAVGDDGSTQALIRTVHGRGYRFVGRIDALPADGPPPAPTGAPPDEPTAEPLPDEYKTVSVLVCGSSVAARGARTDTERRHAFLGELQRLACDVVEQLDGVFLGAVDEQLVVLFGAPVAYEDHPRRALLAATELRQRLASDTGSRAHDTALPLSVGLHLGQVLFRAAGAGESPTATSVGDTIAAAAELQRAAPAGQIWLSAPMNTALGHHASSTLVADGAAETRQWFQFERTESAEPWVHTAFSRRHLAPFLGRDQEMAALERALRLAQGSRGQVVGIVGEAGLGKSRLLREFIAGAADSQGPSHPSERAPKLLVGHCASFAASTPYSLVRGLLRRATAVQDDDSLAGAQAKLTAHLEQIGLSIEPADSDRLLDILLPGQVPADPVEEGQLPPDPALLRARTFELLNRIFLRWAAQAPLLLVVDDLHWIDATSEQWLSALAAEMSAAPLLLLTGQRPGYSPPWLGQSNATQISLGPLPDPVGREIVHSVLGQRALEPTTEAALIRKAQGNPFFLEELARYLGQRSEPSSEQFGSEVPDSVSAVLTARMDRLAPRSKSLLQLAAILGNPLRRHVLSALCDYPEDTLRAILRELAGAEFLHPATQQPDTLLEFRHGLSQEVIYQALTGQTRRELSQRIAALLEQSFADLVERQPELLARHHATAENHRAAVPLWVRAAERATERAATQEAINHLRAGLQSLQTLQASPQRDAQEIRLQLALGGAHSAVSGYPAAAVEQAYGRARTLCEAAGAKEPLFMALGGLAFCYFLAGRYADAREVQQRMLEIAPDTANPTASAIDAHGSTGMTLTLLGEIQEARVELQQANNLALGQERVEGSLLADRHRRMASLAYLANAQWLLGYPDQARAASAEMLQQSLRVPHPFHAVGTHHMRATLLVMLRETGAASDEAGRAIALADKYGFPFYERAARIHRAWAMAKLGASDEALPEIRRELKLLGPETPPCTTYAALLGDALLSVEHPDEGLAVIAKGLQWADERHERVYLPELYRIKAELLLARAKPDDRDQARQCLHEGLRLASQMNMRAWELRCATSLLQHADRDDAGAARAALAKTYDWFSEGFDTPDLQDAARLLDR